MTGTPTLTTLVSFNGANGAAPDGDLIADANGDLFGTTALGGANEDGTVFEIPKTAGAYASIPTTLVSTLEAPERSLIADANGDLFGTTADGGANGLGSVFEIAKTAGGYASTPTTLVSFNGTNSEFPEGSLIVDCNGDLVGAALQGGANGDGTVFEIVKTAGGYASAPTTVVSFNIADGVDPHAGLIADANGDLFGTTALGGANGDGTVFEIAKTAGGYASTPTTLVSFNERNGSDPIASLIADSNGDLFGTTANGGANGDGTVFEIAKTAGGYASTPTTLVSFNHANGAVPEAGLIADAKGDLLGATEGGGANGDGAVFEIAKTAGGYASTPTTLVSFNKTNGPGPTGSLIADSNGDLFGTSGGGANSDGTVFEIAGSDDLLWQNTSGQASIWDMNGNALVGGGPVSVANPGPSWKAIGMGEFDGGGVDDILWQNTTSGQASIWQMNGNSLIGGGPVSPNPGPNWRAVGVGDFDGDGLSDILWQNISTGQASIWEMKGNSLTGGGPVTPNPGPAWKAIGTGDFNKDGDADILFQNTSTGQVSIWEMDGNTLMGGGPVSPNPGPSWHAIGTGDFNHDGFSDILFQNASTGQVSIWEMNGSMLTGGGPVSPNPGPSWHAIGTDGDSAILFQNTSGQASIWEMNGNKLIGGGPVSPDPGPSWRAVDLT